MTAFSTFRAINYDKVLRKFITFYLGRGRNFLSLGTTFRLTPTMSGGSEKSHEKSDYAENNIWTEEG
jgi:hypothetical protein